MATSCWCKWVSDHSSFTSRESWMGLEVSHTTSRFLGYISAQTAWLKKRMFIAHIFILSNSFLLHIHNPFYLICKTHDWCEGSPCFVWFRDDQGQERAAEDSHLHGPLPWDGGNVFETICWYLNTNLYHIISGHYFSPTQRKVPQFTSKYSRFIASLWITSSMITWTLLGPDEPFIYSHPKLEKLEEVVLQHFRLWADSSASNNGDLLIIMVICCDSYTQWVQAEICNSSDIPTGSKRHHLVRC